MTNPQNPPTGPEITGAGSQAPASDPAEPRHVEIRDEDDQPVAEAEVTTALGPEGTVRTSLHAQSGHVQPGQRASLVDAVMDLPEVQASDRVEATVPYGDGESLDRLRERTIDPQTRAAGATTLLDADLPGGDEGAGQAAAEPAVGEDPA
jgi:hypothetical protein